MRQLLHIFILLLISFGLFAHSETTGAEFIANKGQWESPVLYKTAISSGAAYVELDGITFSFYHAEDAAALHDLQRATDEEKEAFQIRGHAWKMDFLNNLVPSFSEEGKRSHYYNYFHGQDKSQWTGKVPTYDHVRYQQLYAGVDMKLYHHDKNFKYDFIVAPGADPTPISWRYEGLDKLGLSKGVLQLHTSIGQFVESRPYAYQVIDGKETEVRCLYELNDGVVSFSYPDGYDTDYPLIIDPELVASTLSGSIGDIINFGHCATYDRLGNIYTGCVSGGPGYPVTLGSYSQSYAGGQWDIGISKLNPDGSDLLWATYIGGEAADYPHSIIVNQDLEIYVYGSSRSEGFPTTSSAFQPSLGGNSDIIVSHLSEDGSELVGSTYIGGFGNDGFNAQAFNYGDAYRGEINLDNEENPIIVSHSTSTNFPTLPNSYQSDLNGQQDAVIIGLDPSLSTLQRSTYLGGTYNDAGYGIRMNSEGDIYIAGGANADFPTTANAYQPDFNGSPFAFESSDGFIAKLNGDCTQLLASTYLGTDGSDQAFFIDLNNEEEVFVYGQNGADFPVVGDVFTINNGRQFVSKLSADLSQLLLSTTLGTTFVTVFVPDAFLVDICGNVYISAYYADQQLPTTSDALSDEGGFYLAVFEPDMADIYYGTYYTGNHVDGGTSRFDKNGVVYQAVCSCPPVNDMNTLSNAWATTQEDNCDVGIFKIAFDFGGVNAAIANTDPQGCAPFEVTFENLSIGDVYDWDFGDGETSTAFEPTHTFETPGTYTVSLIATDELSCNYADTTYLDIIVSPPENPEPTYDVDVDCDEQSVTLNVTSGDLFMDYHWDMGDGSTFSSQDSTYEYGSDGDYEIVLTATALGCNPGTEFVSEIDIDISIDPVVTAALQNEVNEACGELALALENLSENASEYEWDFGDGFTSSAATPAHTYTTPGSYDITLTAINPNGCNTSDQASISVTVHPLQSLASDFTIEQTDCAELIVVADNQSVGNDVDYSWDMGDGTILTTEDVTHSYATDGTYTVVLTVTDPLCDISVESTEEITAYPLATAVMNVVDQIGCEPFSVNLATSSPGTAVWDFGDGTAPEEGSALAHNYPLPGVYTVTLTVEGPGACSGVAESTGTIEVVAIPTLDADFSFERIGECEDYLFEFDDNSTGNIDVYNWSFGDGQSSSQQHPTHSFASPGSYPVSLVVSHIICEVENDIQQIVTMEPALLYELPATSFCPEENGTTLDAEIEDATYLWSTGESTQTIDVTQGGVFEVSVQIEDCWNTEQIEVTAVQTPNLDEVVTQCRSPFNRIIVPYDNAQSYVWDDGEVGAIKDIENSGLYGFTIVDEYSCAHEGVIEAVLLPAEPVVYVPSAFTPNADGINDQLRIVTQDLVEYELRIYDRWGGLIFESHDPEVPWIGGENDQVGYYVPDGIYTYKLVYRGGCTTEKIQTHGTVSVFR